MALFDSLESDLWKHNTLRYQWIRYLTVNEIPDDMWGKLERDLIDKLMNQNVLVDVWGQRLFKSMARIVPTWLRDNDGNTLLPDCSCEKCGNGTYISEQYDREHDIPVLKKLDVQVLASKEFVHKLDVDLNKDNSLMWSTDANNKWNTQIFEALLRILKEGGEDLIRGLPLIPLIGKGPTHSKNVSIYLPTCGGIDVPSDLPLGLVQPGALKNWARARLFRKLGIPECDPQQVIGLIEDAPKLRGDRTVTLEQSAQHVKFLYWHHDRIPNARRALHVFDINSQMFDPNLVANGWTYWPSKNGEYHFYRILGSEKHSGELPGKARFFNPAYLKALHGVSNRHETDPERWLASYFTLQAVARVNKRGTGSALSPEIEWLMEHNSELLLRTI